MVGSLTASLAALTGLQSLLLGGNSLTGSVPSAWNTGAALGSLTVINLTANAISALPTNFGAGGGRLGGVGARQHPRHLLEGEWVAE